MRHLASAMPHSCSVASRVSTSAAGRLGDRPRDQLRVEVEHRFLEYCAAAAGLVLGSCLEETERRYVGRYWHTVVEVEEVEDMKHGRQADVDLMVEEGRIG